MNGKEIHPRRTIKECFANILSDTLTTENYQLKEKTPLGVYYVRSMIKMTIHGGRIMPPATERQRSHFV